jgi:hypothetical protein
MECVESLSVAVGSSSSSRNLRIGLVGGAETRFASAMVRSCSSDSLERPRRGGLRAESVFSSPALLDHRELGGGGGTELVFCLRFRSGIRLGADRAREKSFWAGARPWDLVRRGADLVVSVTA